MINLDISRLTGGIFWVLLGLTLAGCTSDETALSEDVDPQRVEANTVLLGGVVASMDPQIVGATAVAVVDYRIAAVGSDDDIRMWVGDKTQIIELDGRMLVPGLIEGHGHFLSFGRAPQIIDLSDIQNWQQP